MYFIAFDHSDGKLTTEEKEATRRDREGKLFNFNTLIIRTKHQYLSGVLEFWHDHGTESDPGFQGYHNGNTEPKGFGHIAISVDNIEEACARFEQLGVRFQKKLTDGKMKNIAFILDPDG